MSITLPGRRRRPAAWGGHVRRSTERPLSAFPTVMEFVAAPMAILLGATFFTSAVEILGRRLGLRQGAVGSRLAGGDTEGGAEIGVGAILAALATEMPEKLTLSSWLWMAESHPDFKEHDWGHDSSEHHPVTFLLRAGLAVV
jgi:hypothetical protein